MVEQILKEASLGVSYRLHVDTDLLTPHIVCALEPNTVIFHRADQDIDVYDVCKANPSSTVLLYPETSDIFICATFFRLPPMPPAGHCPTVNEATNQFEGNFAAFWVSRMYFLLHEIVQFYLGISAEERLDGIMDWNYAFSLSAINATFNALNYVLYVASK